jgi:hypothetical protein
LADLRFGRAERGHHDDDIAHLRLIVSRLDCLSEVRHPLAARESPCVRLPRFVRLRRLFEGRLPVLAVGNTRVRAVG